MPSSQRQARPFGDIADRLVWHRSQEGLDQRTYAERAGLKRTQLSNWESGSYRLSNDGALALRTTYGLSLDFIYAGSADSLPMSLRAAWLSGPQVEIAI
ncbi:helix-turn-helix transcriptional regulator [uncultured Paracoccus sp.]|uniref:helix-turn-helix domain-containing protein n=1 Tax=uncultured Paracoccus sp. TaxID=189685 RepID=UPI0034579059